MGKGLFWLHFSFLFALTLNTARAKNNLVVKGDPKEERYGIDMEFNIPRTLGNLFRVMEIDPQSLAHNQFRNWLDRDDIDAYLDNPEAFESLSPELRAELSQGLSEPKSSLVINESKIESPELPKQSDSGLLLGNEAPAQTFSLLGSDGLPLSKSENKPAAEGELILSTGEIKAASDAPENSELKQMNSAFTEKSHAGLLDLTSTQKNASYWDTIRSRWKKLDLELKRQNVSANYIPGEVKAVYFLSGNLSPTSLRFRQNLDKHTQDLLADFDIGIDSMGALEMRYKENHAIHGLNNHLERVQLLASLAGVQRFVNDPLLEPTQVFITDTDRNEKGFSLHTHISGGKGDLLLASEINLLDLLAKLRALKKGGDPARVGAGHIAFGDRSVGRGLNKFEKSFEWRTHLLPPKEEFELSRKLVNMTHLERENFLTQEINQHMDNPKIRKQITDHHKTFLKKVHPAALSLAFGDVLEDPEGNLETLKTFRHNLWPALALKKNYSPERRKILFDLYESGMSLYSPEATYFDTLKTLANDHDLALQTLLASPDRVRELDKEGKIANFIKGAMVLGMPPENLNQLRKAVYTEAPLYLEKEMHSNSPTAVRLAQEVLAENPKLIEEVFRVNPRPAIILWEQDWLPKMFGDHPLRAPLAKAVADLKQLLPRKDPPPPASRPCSAYF